MKKDIEISISDDQDLTVKTNGLSTIEMIGILCITFADILAQMNKKEPKSTIEMIKQVAPKT